MRRRDFIKAIVGSAAAWPLMASAQQSPTKVPRIGWLVTGAPPSYRFSLGAFRDGLRSLGYVEGRNVSIEYRWAEGNLARLPELAKDLVDERVDVILAGGSVGAKAAKDATSVVPIVVAGAGDLIEIGVAKSLARPGGNLTGFIANLPDMATKRFQIIKELMPSARRAAVLWNPTDSYTKVELNIAKEFAAANDIDILLHDARDIEELRSALASIPQSTPNILIVLSDPFMFTHRKIVADAVGKLRLPAVYGYREYVDDGGMMSYGASITDTYRRAAGYVDRILNGANPGDLPIQLPIMFELVVNLKTAKMIGFALPDSFLLRADEVIE
jgi:ABC-type uncharacterized transport system substrate-binding protein